LTGPAAPARTSTVQARVAVANAAGGINGHKIVLEVADTQSTPQGALTGAKILASKHVVGVLSDTAIDGPAVTYLNQQGIPLVGSSGAPTWLANKNQFQIVGNWGPGLPNNAAFGDYLKGQGVKSVAGLTYGNLPLGAAFLDPALASAKSVGIPTVLHDTSLTFGSADFTAAALAIKNSNADAVYPVLSSPDGIAFVKALRDAGAKTKVVLAVSAYEKSFLDSPSLSSLQGTSVILWFAPQGLATPGVEAYEAALKKYAPGTFPGDLESLAWASTDLLLTGIGKVQGDVTPSTLIAALHTVTNYDAGGLLPGPLNFSVPPTQNLQKCFYFVKIEGKAYVPSPKTPVCGSVLSKK
jgi:branched-chain amino acid transport system substrate-binding protein